MPGPPPAPVVVVVAPTQAEPDWQTAPTQQAAPLAPQFMQVRLPPDPAHARPELHEVAPPQQGCPSPPQAVHMLEPAPPSAPAVVAQASPVPQLPLPKPQHACPLVPHASHIPFVQRAPEAVHVMIENPPPPGPPPAPLPPPAPVEPQQIWPTAPQVVPVPSWQEPLLHVPVVPFPPVQAAPLAWHIPVTQHPPPLQVLAAQQLCPSPPQAGAAVPPEPAPVAPPEPVLAPPEPVLALPPVPVAGAPPVPDVVEVPPLPDEPGLLLLEQAPVATARAASSPHTQREAFARLRSRRHCVSRRFIVISPAAGGRNGTWSQDPETRAGASVVRMPSYRHSFRPGR